MELIKLKIELWEDEAVGFSKDKKNFHTAKATLKKGDIEINYELKEEIIKQINDIIIENIKSKINE